MFLDLIVLMNILSGLAFLITTIIYSITPAIKDVEGKCIFHYCLNTGLAHLSTVLVSMSVSDQDHFCVTRYTVPIFFVIISFYWLHALSFNTWRIARHKTLPKSGMLWYYVFGYGLPLSMIFAAIFELYFIVRINENKDAACTALVHTQGMIVAVPSTLFLITIPIYYFVDVRNRAWKMYKSNNSNQSALKKMRYRYLLYLKLSAVMGLPWFVALLVFFICFPLIRWVQLNVAYEFVLLVISSEGVTFFIMMVVLRKKILRYIFEREYCGFKLCCKFTKNVNQSEDEDVDDDDDDDHSYPEYNVDNAEQTSVELKEVAPAGV